MWDKIRGSRNFQDSSGRLLSPKIFHRINKRWGNSSNTWIQSLSLDSSIHSMEAKSSEPSKTLSNKIGAEWGSSSHFHFFFQNRESSFKGRNRENFDDTSHPKLVNLETLLQPNTGAVSTLQPWYSQILELWEEEPLPLPQSNMLAHPREC